MKYALRLFLLAALVVAPFTTLAVTDAIVRIDHNPVTFASVGRPITIESRVGGDYTANQVAEAYLWFRNVDQESYDYVEMILTGETFSAQIPGSAVVSVGMEYYIEMKFDDGVAATFPDGGMVNPVLVSVEASGETVTNTQILIISPEDNQSIMGNEVLIALSFNQALGTIDPQKIVLHLDGKNRTDEANISTEVLTAVIDGLKPGKHRIDLLYESDSGREVLATWFFNMISPTERKERVGYRKYLNGYVSAEGTMAEISGANQNIGRESFSLTFKTGSFNAVARGRFSSLEHRGLQPQHRFLFSMGMPWWRMRAGDINPRYNDILLFGSRVRGFELAVKPGPLNVYAVYGEMYRHVSQLSYTQRIIEADIDYSDPANPDTTWNVERDIYNTSTFRRLLSALKISSDLGFKDRIDFGFTVMKVVDEKQSVFLPDSADVFVGATGYTGAEPLDSLYARTNYIGTTPKDNLVSGFNLDMNFDRRRIVMSVSTGLSLYNDNIYEEPFNAAKDYKQYMYINSYFVPLPDEGLSDDTDEASGDEEIKMEDVAKSILANSFSYDSKLRLRYLYNDLRIGYRKINSGFRTLGNPSLLYDDAGYYVRDRIRLYQSRLYLNLGYSSYHNNVNDKSDITLNRDEIMVGFNVYTDPRYPDFNFTFRNQVFENDAEQTILYGPDPAGIQDSVITDTLDSRYALNNNMINFGMSYGLETGSLSHRLMLNMITSDRTFDFQNNSDANSLMLNFGVNTEYPGPYMTRLNVSNTNNTAIGGETDINYLTLAPRIDFLLLNRKLVPYFGPRITMASGDNMQQPIDPGLDIADPAAAAAARATTVKTQLVDYTRIDLVAGVEYEFYPNHVLSGLLSISTHSENGQWEMWDGTTYPLDAGSVTTTVGGTDYTISLPEAPNRNDFLFNVIYTYRF